MADKASHPKPKTQSEKQMSLRHTRETLALEKKHLRDHSNAPQSPYNKAHKRDHQQGVKKAQSRVQAKQRALRRPGPGV